MPNQRVSLEEVRARRLAKEAKQGKLNDNQELTPLTPILTESRTETIQEGQSEPPADAQPSAETAPEPAPAAVASLIAANPTPANLDDFLNNLTPDQLAKIRILAAAKGLTTATAITTAGAKLPDGSMNVSVHLDPQVTEP